MTNLPTIVSLIALLLSNCYAIEQLNFNIENENTDKIFHSYNFNYPKCAETNDCKLFLGEVHVGYAVTLNGKIVINQLDDYLTPDSVSITIPSKLFTQKNKLEIRTRSFTSSRSGIKTNQIFLDRAKNVEQLNSIDWLIRTGTTLSSIWTLVIAAILLICILVLNFDRNILAILIYSIVSILYLISFSEIPRKYYNPNILSGLVHFPLRLFQDLCLTYLFNTLLAKNKKNKVYLTAVFTYIFVIALMLLSGFFGFRDYEFQLSIIKISALLVAFPMGFALYLAFKCNDKFERKVLIPFSFVLFIFQINDLLIFWQIIDSFYFVKIYIPIVIALLVFIQIYQNSQIHLENSILASAAKMALQIAHDLKSPTLALRTSLQGDLDAEDKIMALKSLKRIEDISNSLLPGFNKKILINIEQICEEIIKEKLQQFPNAQINLIINSNFHLEATHSELSRLLSNLINNSIESSTNPKIEITIDGDNFNKQIVIADNGKGIDQEIINNIGKMYNTSGKEHGSGLGLRYMDEIMKKFGKYEISSSNEGTVISLFF